MPTETLTQGNATMKAHEMLKNEDALATNPARDRSKPLPSFAIRDLSVLAYANGFTLWHYKAGTLANLLSSNFFADCSDMMAGGDHIHVSAPDGAAVLAVESSDAGKVSVRKLLG